MRRWWRFYVPLLTTLVMAFVPTKAWLASAAVADTVPRVTNAARMGLSSAKPYASVLIAETAGRTDVQLDKAQAMVGETFVELVVPLANGAGSLGYQLVAGKVAHRTSFAITEDKQTATMTAVHDGATVAVATVDKASNEVLSGWADQGGKRVDLKGWTPPVKDNAHACGLAQWWNCMDNCFASFGILNYIIMVISIVCISVAETVIGAIACIIILGLIAEWMLGRCMFTCRRYAGGAY